MTAPPESKKVLIVVRTYPVPAKKEVEVSCTAGITDSGNWIRLFPIPYRFLDEDQRFRKYQWVKVLVRKATGDQRPESFRLMSGSIEILSDLPAKGTWEARKDVIFPLKVHCLCCLKRQRDEKGFPTLGFFRPRVIERLIIEPDTPTWSEKQLAKLRHGYQQGRLFEKGPKLELDKVPYSFRYQFRCNDDNCPGHAPVCTDWEMGASWRKWKDDYGSDWEVKFRQRYETEMIEKNDTHFYVGTVHRYPGTWIIVGLFYPPRSAQRSLFH